MKWPIFIFQILIYLCPLIIFGQQTQKDSYTKYELLDPATQSFRIVYDVSATSSNANFYWNTLRKGSEHIVHAVWDSYSGKELKWKIVAGPTALQNGLKNASEDYHYLQVELARKVPLLGEARIRIDKTYKDPKSYFLENNKIVFTRSLGIKRNSVILPKGYELESCNYPSQIQLTEEGKIKVSFLNTGSEAIPLHIVGRPLPNNQVLTFNVSTYERQPNGEGPDKSKARLGWKFEERAFQNREIVYFLQQPETHSFDLYHDYTEDRIGIDRYLNIVRKGSKASKPSAIILDTDEILKVETLVGKEINDKNIDLEMDIKLDTEVIVVWFDPIRKGASKRLRITETYTDPNRYLIHNDELVWDRSFGRNRNTVVLPHGWVLTTSSIPCVVDIDDKDRSRLYFVNDRPDQIDVFIKAHRRKY